MNKYLNKNKMRQLLWFMKMHVYDTNKLSLMSLVRYQIADCFANEIFSTQVIGT